MSFRIAPFGNLLIELYQCAEFQEVSLYMYIVALKESTTDHSRSFRIAYGAFGDLSLSLSSRKIHKIYS